ncbi:terminase, partial [Salmonella enterica subsp. enterica serovar Minnesota]|nr:terminase [Salmonella enterica subsp. enterica serovar Minnesota]
SDLHRLQKVSGPTGQPRFVAESDAAGHADRTWACFLALNAAGTDTGPTRVYSRGTRRVPGILRGY